MSVALRVENVSKLYHLGQIGYGTLREDLASWWARVRGKEDPNARVSASPGAVTGRTSSTIMALKDVSLEQREGEITGIIGSNGAGKSTLLKLINGLTAPTKGRILLRGRVGSLLEVGTGFHPELTGRENVFLNGAILGMTKAEVRRKFDQIVAFSGVERFIDTPVKRYSSGMYVRLGFSVAAHLEPEIMLIDEVLAVGDAQFQKKCREKIRQLARKGQSILFVSHSMQSVREVCHRGIVIHDGSIVWSGGAEEATQVHLELQLSGHHTWDALSFVGPLSPYVTYSEIEINGTNAAAGCVVSPESIITISAYGECTKGVSAYRTSVGIFRDGVRVVTLHDLERPEPLSAGKFRSEVRIPPFFLRPGRYSVGIGGHDDTGARWVWAADLVNFSVREIWTDQYPSTAPGLVNLQQVGGRETIAD